MTIKKPPARLAKTDAIEQFIEAAPDGGSKPAVRPEKDGESVQITLRISKADLATLDAAAQRLRIPRASFIRQAVWLAIEK
jgi:hypothetical protein